MKHLRLLSAVLTVLGAILVSSFFIYLYMVFDLSEKVLIIQALVPEPYLGYLLLFSLIGGTAILTTGICWKVRLRSKNHKNKYTLLSALLIPLLMSTLIFSIMFFRDPWYQPAEKHD